MRKSWLLLSCLMLAVVLVGTGGCAPAEAMSSSSPSVSAPVGAANVGEGLGLICSQQNVGMWVTGVGKAVAVPDVALLRLGIESEASTVAEAQRKAAESMNKVMKALKSGGVSEQDIQTQRFSVYAVRKWIENENREEIIGYRVTNIVVAKIRDIDKAGIVIDAVAGAAGDPGYSRRAGTCQKADYLAGQQAAGNVSGTASENR